MSLPRRGTAGHRFSSELGIAIGVLLAACPARAFALEYQVDTSQQNEVRFISDAPMEDFEGVTPKIDGYVFWQGDSLVVGTVPKSSEFYFEVPLATLSTGIDMRDRHMRENYLHTSKHPYVSYKGEITGVERSAGDTLTVNTKGQLDLHGHKKDYVVPCRIVLSPPGYAVAARFDIKLTDFDIEVPSLMFMKINEVIQVQVNVHVAPAR